ncbi:MAG: hypothetical protein Q4P29_01350 [Tissierellia bacterium]|nr:hypothetical protein [Tissierellia bacterium]
MSFKMPVYLEPDLDQAEFKNAPDIKTALAQKDGVPPKGFHLSTVYPEYYKLNGKWLLPINIPYTCPVIKGDKIIFKEPDLIQKNDECVLEESILTNALYIHKDAFENQAAKYKLLHYEQSESEKYDDLAKLMRLIKSQGAKITWVMGPAVVFNYDTREALQELIQMGYVNALLAGNALATHDLEGGYLKTALGQDIYTQISQPNGHYNHLDTINEARRLGSIKEFINSGEIEDGIIKECVNKGIPIVLAGSIRDDGPLPSVYSNIDEGLENMESQLKDSALVINLATMLHSVSAASMTPTFRKFEEDIYPVYVYTVDITEYAVGTVSKVRADLFTEHFITNVQDFVFNLTKLLKDTTKEAK